MLKVKKAKNGNKGRRFYCCARPREDQCDHFGWCEDHAPAVAAVLRARSSLLDWRSRAVDERHKQREAWSVAEIKSESRRRRVPYTSGPEAGVVGFTRTDDAKTWASGRAPVPPPPVVEKKKKRKKRVARKRARVDDVEEADDEPTEEPPRAPPERREARGGRGSCGSDGAARGARPRSARSSRAATTTRTTSSSSSDEESGVAGVRVGGGGGSDRSGAEAAARPAADRGRVIRGACRRTSGRSSRRRPRR